MDFKKIKDIVDVNKLPKTAIRKFECLRVSQNVNCSFDKTCYLIDASTSSVIAKLPKTIQDHDYMHLKRLDSNNNYTVTVIGTDNQTIDGSASAQLAPKQFETYHSMNGNWITIFE